MQIVLFLHGNQFWTFMKIALILSFLLTALMSHSIFAQDCCTEEIVKFEKKLSKKYDSFKRIVSTPKDGEISSMREIFYHVEKKGMQGIINGERVIIFGEMWDNFQLIETPNFKENYTFFSYQIGQKSGLGSVQRGLHLPAQFESVQIRVTEDPSTVFLIGSKAGGSRIDWKQKDSEQWFSKQLDFLAQDINIYERAAVKKYALYDNLLFVGGKKKSICYELKTGVKNLEGPYGYIGTVDIDGFDIPALLTLNHDTGNYALMNTNAEGAFQVIYTYNERITTGHLIEEGLIIAKTAEGKYKIPLGKYEQAFQLAAHDKLYHSSQNLFLVDGDELTVINKQGTKKVVLADYFETDRCGNYQPNVHTTEESETYFGHDIQPLHGSILITKSGKILNDDLYLVEVMDSENCFYLFWKDELSAGLLGVAAPKNKRGVLNAKGETILPEEYSAIWKTGDYYLTMKGGKVSSTIMLPTVYSEGEWILYDSNFKPVKDPIKDVSYEADVIFGRDGFKVGEKFYTTYEFTEEYFGIGVR
ncbi:MAG: hypothetical protein ACI837_000529 [Crocinitomicaceae bacterium]|jgi:hypothetical protein